jgi:hypothetical protein
MKKVHTLVYRFSIFLVLLISSSPEAIFANSVSLMLQQAPLSIRGSVRRELTGPAADFNAKFEQVLPKLSGFPAIYGGYVDYSDADGKLEFPLLHKAKKLYLVISSKIKLIKVHGNTISHKNFEDVPKKIYLFERKKNADKTYFWRVSETENSKEISPLSIVILTDPNNIVVPIGDFMTEKTANIVLPHVYVVGNEGNAKATIKFLDIRRFFEPIKKRTAFEKGTEKRIITNN